MIRFSFSSFYMSLLFVNVMIVFLYLTFRSQKLLLKLGLPLLGSAAFLAILRMLLPFEFLKLSHNIYLPNFISNIIGKFLHTYFWEGRLSCWSVVQIIWGTGILIAGVYCWCTEHITLRDIKTTGRRVSKDEPAYRAFARVKEELPETCDIEVWISPLPAVPMIYGIRHPRILLPDDLALDEEQLYYILRHEAMHYLHHDTLLKVGMEVICIIYWWNPLCRRLKEQADALLEMQIDSAIAKDSEQKVAYLSCLLYVMIHVMRSNTVKTMSAISFCSKTSGRKKPCSKETCSKDSDGKDPCRKIPSVMDHRFNLLLDSSVVPLQKKYKSAIFLVMVTLFVLSFTYILEASSFDSKYNEFNSIAPTAENSYFIERDDGKYDFYLDGIYTVTESSLEYYKKDIPVYPEEVISK